MLTFTLLGQVAIAKDGEPLAWFRSQKEVALLTYLAHTGQTHQREMLAELLWEGSRSTKQALTNLRTAIARLRKQVGAALVVTRKTLALAPESWQKTDSVQLLAMLTEIGELDSAEKATALQNILDTYQGNFLANFHLENTPQFNQWIDLTREQIRRQVVLGYRKLARYALSAGEIEHGLAVTQRWLEIDALDEDAHTLLIRLHIKNNNASAAVTHYSHVVDLLKTQLDVVPSTEMTALIEGIRQTHSRPKSAPLQRTPSTIRHNLPVEYDQFFGRKHVQTEIHARLDQPWCRLVTIVGQGGAGKTRLATTIARSRLLNYPDGVWFVELADIDPDDPDVAEAIAIEIATILDLRLTGAATPIEQLLSYLQHKQLLLVLDNIEHLLDGVQIVLDILRRCDKVQLLVTTRELLGLRAEWAIDLVGLSYPTSDADEVAYDAIDLFMARQAQQRRGAVSAETLIAIRQICRMVEGLPLAIELAAALTRYATPQVVAARLRNDFGALATSLRDVPQRHRSLQVVFEMSWQTLSPELQVRLTRLSIFRGGFTSEAAQQIADVSDQHLAALRDKSLVAYDGASGRYSLHEVVRQFSAEKRPFHDSTPNKHADYYLSLLAQHTEPLQKDTPQHAVAIIAPDIDNVRLAWETGLAERMTTQLSAALMSLSVYYQLRGLAHEAQATMHTTYKTALAQGATHLATRSALEKARFQNRLGQSVLAAQTARAALRLAEQCRDRWAEGMGHVLWAEALWRRGRYDSAEKKLNHALNIANNIDSTELIGWCQHHLGIVKDIQSRSLDALDHLQHAVAAWTTLNNAQSLIGTLNSICIVNQRQGDLLSAQQAGEQAYALCQQINDRYREATIVNSLSNITAEQGDSAGTQYYLQLALELAKPTGDIPTLSNIYHNIGRAFISQRDYDLASENLQKGLQLAQLIDNLQIQASAYLNLAELARKQGNVKKAHHLYEESSAIARQNNLYNIGCQALIGLAELLSQVNQQKAQAYSAEAVDLAHTLQNPKILERATAIDHYLNISLTPNEENLSV